MPDNTDNANKTPKTLKPGKDAGMTPQTDGDDGNTQPEQNGESAPRLPHERDQSSDSQQNKDGSVPKVGKDAFNDVERGVVDTDRGPVTDKVYNEKVKR
ncbi:MAG: hypothetical protein V4636_18430 [Pseudomonadota bacterium]